ncbi:MAG: AAA family ATPase [Myxococcales bacterium]|nr:AAA family ATPase [Myxococcales bacterium]MCB9532331.1 AAA family ATPase [Myxococcales bacterium]MCB9534595.1 AAA family ATPase [Myxococcales bacterium]
MSVEQKIARFTELTGRLRAEVQKVIVGHDTVIDGVLICVLSGGHVLLEGVPGLGKTLLVRTLARALDLDFRRVQFTPDLQPKDIIGAVQIARDESGEERRVFERGPIFANIVLADEVNRATPRTQSALLEAMAERSVTVGTTSHALEEPFFVLATQNPLEQDGTYPLPEAQLDRFQYKLNVGFPTLDELDTIMTRTLSGEEPTVDRVMSRTELLELRAVAREVGITPSLQRFALRILQRTHPTTDGAPDVVRRYVREGASPRGGQAILATARVRALMRGEAVVAESDVIASVKPALRHRVILNFEGEAEGVERDAVLDAIVTGTARA